MRSHDLYPLTGRPHGPETCNRGLRRYFIDQGNKDHRPRRPAVAPQRPCAGHRARKRAGWQLWGLRSLEAATARSEGLLVERLSHGGTHRDRSARQARGQTDVPAEGGWSGSRHIPEPREPDQRSKLRPTLCPSLDKAREHGRKCGMFTRQLDRMCLQQEMTLVVVTHAQPCHLALLSARRPFQRRSWSLCRRSSASMNPPPNPHPRAHTRTRNRPLGPQGPRVRWQTKTPQAALRRSGSGWEIASALIRALPHSPRRAACGFFACLNKSEKGNARNPLVLLSRERRNFDIERKLLTLDRKFLVKMLRSCGKSPSHERRKSGHIFTYRGRK